jgi:Flp pilus assembly protein TadG
MLQSSTPLKSIYFRVGAAASCSRRNRQLGTSLVEYAIVVILFFTLLFGISGFGHALFVYHHLDHVTKEATRYASVRGSTCATDNTTGGSCKASNSASGIAGPTTAADITAYIASITPSSIDSSQFTVTVCGVQGGTVCADSTAPACLTGQTPDLFKAINYPSCIASVRVQYTYNFIFPLVGTVPINMSSTSQMVIVH